MKREEGINPRDHIRRIFRLLLAPGTLLSLNRTGTHGNKKFPPKLEEMIKGRVGHMHMLTPGIAKGENRAAAGPPE